jgi:anti-sigma factor RsiW
MSCEQMMEWMQRFVDEDLPQAEQNILMAHLKQCPDCAASFEQLQHLSAELSRLPMVSPPFSIVDSILPKLAELDAQQAFVQVAYLPEKIHNKKSLFSWKMGAGFVAAAILFSVIAVNLTPSSTNDASELLTAAIGEKNSKKSDQVQSSGATDHTDHTDQQRNGITSVTASPKASEAPKATPAATAEPKIRAFSEAMDTAQQDKSTGAVQEQSIASEPPQTTNKSTSTATKPEPTINVNFSRAVTEDSTNAYKIAPVVPSPTPAPIPKKDVKGKGARNSISSIEESSARSAPSLASDDGNLIGLVERQIVEVRTADGDRIYTSNVQWKSTDVIQLIKWEDNSHLTYEVTLEDGQLKRFVIDPILKTEQEQ